MRTIATELAKAYVQIIPSAEGIKGKLTEALGGEAEAAGESAGKKAGGSFGSALAGAAKAGMAALAAGGAGVAALAKEAIGSYAEYEQLVGGVETLFKDAAGTVQQYAAEAFQTAGISANEYMSTVTSFSASLLQSLGGDTEQAASVADMAIRDMSDNANKMGTDMSAIQTAYQGFAKQNYTMLDNLKLGYGGTKTEMERLLADATALSGVEYDINSLSDVYEAIHVIQTELDITGTTAKEASSTISGSLGSMQAAWQNLITGIANENADMSGLIDSFVESVYTVADNLVPRIGQALSGIGQLVTELAPVLAEGASSLISEVLPSLMEAGATLIGALGTALVDNAPLLIQTGLDIVLALVQGLAENAESLASAAQQIVIDLGDWLAEYSSVLIDAAVELILTLAQAMTDPERLSEMIETALYLIESLADGLIDAVPKLLEQAPVIIGNLAKSLTDPAQIGELIDTALTLIISLADGLIEALPELIEQAPVIVTNLMEAIIENAPKLLESAFQLIVKLVEGIMTNLPQILEAGTQMVFSVIEGIVKTLGELVKKGKEIVDSVKQGFDQKLQDAKNWGRDLIQNFIGGIKEKWENLKSTVSNVASTVKSFLGFSEPELGPLSDFSTYAPDMMKLYAEGISKNRGLVLTEAERLAGDLNGVLTGREPQLAYAGMPSGPAYSGAGDMRSIQQEIRDTLEALRGMQVVVNGNALVGVLTAPLNRSLGEQYDYNRRGI